MRDPIYGHFESNPVNRDMQEQHKAAQVTVAWNDARLARVVRFRLLGDPGFPFLDVSYCWGELKDGSPCRVDLPFSQLPKRGWRRAVVEEARREGVFAKGLGLLDEGVVSILI